MQQTALKMPKNMPWQGGQKFSDKNYLKIFILGQNFSENYCPRTQKFYRIGQKF